ncbi:hypothetical protein AA23498_2730 [Acetobacter nitrogenifigens DSM 23921 = NBRC 105050]|uniref:Uncharacterized protein n=1 Tax=Acetobacter nitrogenifigens DSM 23921 = NBRC 105050 TaxID=1120919 RepID=A0A511XDZ5_9PROT|nr:hypothetical protein [Acetobacter nitrogenifigens]GBQ96781.1 hypothetical protein AA23498_2730 [Acetobacter nitrogenifigens DSM 23921 = NBRC 105050]GEN61121.1 hypothetical protein ANI02nite_30050 [Acetobacter nitrogenifigens DSM 23921 = NBRC 105050]
MSAVTHMRAVSDAALERCQSASALIGALLPLLDPTAPQPSALQVAHLRSAALSLVDAALTEPGEGGSTTRLVGVGLAAAYTGMPLDDFLDILNTGRPPSHAFVDGEPMFNVKILDDWQIDLSLSAEPPHDFDQHLFAIRKQLILAGVP